MNHSLLQNNHSQARESVSTDNSPIDHMYQLIIITGALFFCICCLYTLIYCVETTDDRQRRGIRLVITPFTVPPPNTRTSSTNEAGHPNLLTCL